MNTKRFAVVLAAGKSTRFKSGKSKILHTLCGKPLVVHILDKLQKLEIEKTLVVIGHQSEDVELALKPYPVDFVVQEEQLGTGHAVMTAASKFKDTSGSLLVTYGDTPLIRTETLESLFSALEQHNADQVLLTAIDSDPTGYGRVIRDQRGEAMEIVEESDANAEQKKITEINTGFYCFKISSLLGEVFALTPSRKTQEYYLTDLVNVFHQQGGKIMTLSTDQPDETWGINDRQQLSTAESKLRSQITTNWMRRGVTLLDPSSVYIDDTVEIGPDTTIYPGAILEGNTKIGSGCVIYGFSHLKDAILGEDVIVDHCSVIRDSSVGRSTRVGPFAHLRQNCEVASEARIGNFVEMKKSRLGKGSKAAHLSYVGDTEIGDGANIGAGTITCNYDGTGKYKTIIQDGVFVGSGSQLVAPVTLHKGAYVAAGSTITEDVPEQSLGIARGRQVNKKGWVKKRKK